MTKAKTQKAKGVIDAIPGLYYEEYGFDKSYYGLKRFSKRARHSLITSADQIKTNGKLPCFARPCPKRPRHGFVESRVIKGNKQLMNLWQETRKIDPEAELILGPYISDVKYNSVYVNSGNLVIGKGNDGATGGRSSLSIPVAPHKFSSRFMSDAGIKKKESVYLESVYSKSQGWLLAQARGGPKVDSVSSDFIPKRVRVKEVIEPINDLVKWEKQVALLAPGTVVYGNGHSLASHAAIHCVLNKIPFVTSHRPKIGEILAPKGNKTHKINRDGFKKGVRAAINISKGLKNVDNILKYFYYSLSVLHNWAYISKSEHADWLFGSASMLFVTIGSALCHGEFRHRSKDPPARETVYRKNIKYNVKSLNDLPKVLTDFYSNNWRGGYGGLPWATCSWYTYSMWQEIIKTFNKNTASLSEKEVANIMGLMNKTTNMSHNSGWWFDKIAEGNDLDTVALNPGIAAFVVADMIYEIRSKVKAVKGVSKKISSINKINAPCGRTKSGELIWLRVHDVYDDRVVLQLTREDGYITHSHINNLPKIKCRKLLKQYERNSDGLFASVLPNNKFKFDGITGELDLNKEFCL